MYITYHIKITVASLSLILQNSVLVALLWRKPTVLYWPKVINENKCDKRLRV